MARDQASSLRRKVRQVDSRPLWAVVALGRRARAAPFARDIAKGAMAGGSPLGILQDGVPEAGSPPILVSAGEREALRWGVLKGTDVWCVLIEASMEGLESFRTLLGLARPGRPIYLAMGPVPSFEAYTEAFNRLKDIAGGAADSMFMLGAYVTGEGLVLADGVPVAEGVRA